MPKNILKSLIIILLIAILIGCTGSNSLPSFKNFYSQSSPSSASTATRAKITEDAFWQGNSNTTWDRLQHVPLKTLETTDPDDYRTAWIDLAILSKRYNDNTQQLVQQLLAWRKKNPSHPGNQLFPNNEILNSLLVEAPTKHIALLLPLQGPMASSGQAVRDGFLSAYYEELSKTHHQQTISFYDTTTNPNIAVLYQEALAKGAEMVVGPLTKEEVQALLNSSRFNVPTLALNYTDGSLPSNFYEFGLSPEHESEQIADKAWSDGRSRALIIAPQNPWGQRVTNSLVARWSAAGGSVVDTYYFTPQTDLSKGIANLLHASPIDKNKKNNGNKKENKTESVDQKRRQDFDVIFLLAQPQEGRIIVPMLKFYYANDIPIYATSSIYSGTPNPQKDTDLNGVIFSDIPWVLKSNPSQTNRLFAVGKDAYLISASFSRIVKLPGFPLYAATGALTLAPSQHIYRRLPSAQILNGHP